MREINRHLADDQLRNGPKGITRRTSVKMEEVEWLQCIYMHMVMVMVMVIVPDAGALRQFDHRMPPQEDSPEPQRPPVI